MAKVENYESLMQALGKKRKSSLSSHKAKTKASAPQVNEITISASNEFLHLENEAFDYQILDNKTQSELRAKETALKDVFANAYTEMGKLLKEAQTLLASHDKNTGIFESWYTSLGFKKDSVYRLISRYDLLANCEDIEKELVERIPLSLAYEISKPSCVESLKKKVLSGEIKTLKEFKDLQKEISVDLTSKKDLRILTKRDIQTKKAKLLTAINEFRQKSSLSLNDQDTFSKLFNLFGQAEKSLKKINQLLE